MAEATDRRVALFAIHPHYAEAILAGEKRVEFRRKGPAVPISHIVVYATAPVRKVVGWFAVGDVETDSPVALWDRFGPIGGIEQGAFERYYSACEVGLAFTVADARALDEPMGLEELALGPHAPQSFRYVDQSLISALERRCEATTLPARSSPQ